MSYSAFNTVWLIVPLVSRWDFFLLLNLYTSIIFSHSLIVNPFLKIFLFFFNVVSCCLCFYYMQLLFICQPLFKNFFIFFFLSNVMLLFCCFLVVYTSIVCKWFYFVNTFLKIFLRPLFCKPIM